MHWTKKRSCNSINLLDIQKSDLNHTIEQKWESSADLGDMKILQCYNIFFINKKFEEKKLPRFFFSDRRLDIIIFISRKVICYFSFLLFTLVWCESDLGASRSYFFPFLTLLENFLMLLDTFLPLNKNFSYCLININIKIKSKFHF